MFYMSQYLDIYMILDRQQQGSNPGLLRVQLSLKNYIMVLVCLSLV
jgi:hypothetical protein